MRPVSPLLVGQFLRYAAVGLVSNAALYVLYLTATALGGPPKSVMTALYVLGTLQTFLFNRSWSFRASDRLGPSLWRYALLYGGGYLLNYMLLVALVEQLEWPHQLVQGAAIPAIAVFLFVGQWSWVFRRRAVAHENASA